MLGKDPHYAGPALDVNGVVKKQKLHVGTAESLLAMSDELIFFTPAVLYLHGRLTDMPWANLMYEVGRDISLYFRKFPHPIFHGLASSTGSPDWNYVLWAVKSDDWSVVLDFLCSLTMSIREAGLALRYGQQVFEITDPLAMERAGIYRADLPTLPISAFGIRGNTFRLAFDLETLPTLRRYVPDSNMIAFGRAHLQGRNPLYESEPLAYTVNTKDKTNGAR